MARTGFGTRLRQPDRGQDEPGRRAAQGACPPVLAAGARRAGHEHRPVPAGGGPLQADARRHPRTGGLRHAVLHPHQGHAAPPRHPAAGRGGTTGARRPRRLHGDLGRRPARRPRARGSRAAGAARPGPRDHRRRPAVWGLPRAGAARADRPRGRARPRPGCDRRGGRHRCDRHPAAPASRCSRVVHGLALPGSSRAGATLRAAVRAPRLRPGRVPHLAGAAGGSAARETRPRPAEGRRRPADRSAPATGVPGNEPAGFPAGSLPSGGLPVGGASAPAADRLHETQEGEQLALL
jgi:hypothetical protein